jgi:hypothetical protein
MESYDNRFEGIDLGKLLEDLCRFVTRRFHREFRNQTTVLRGNAFSPQDLVHEALTKFIIKNVDWQPLHPENPQADMFRFVRRIVHNGFLDLVKDGRAYKRTQSSGDIEIEEGLEGFKEDSISDVLIRDLTDAEIAERAYGFVKGEPELLEYLRCVLQEGITKRSRVAQALNISLAEATRRRDRLQTRLTPLKRALEARRARQSNAV